MGIRSILKYRDKKNRMRFKYAKYRKSLPVDRNVILFESFHGKEISDTPLAMARALLEMQSVAARASEGKLSGDTLSGNRTSACSSYQLYFSTNDLARDEELLKKLGLDRDIKLVHIHSYEYTKLLATAGLMINNSSFPSYIVRRDEQLYLQTWHGTPWKTLGRSMKGELSTIQGAQHNFIQASHLLFPNEFTRDAIMRDYVLDDIYTGKVLLCGYPRNSVFCDSEKAAEIKKLCGDEKYSTLAYMPTWRGADNKNIETDSYVAETVEMLRELDSALADDQKLYVNLHPIVQSSLNLKGFRHIYTFPKEIEKYEFINSMDALITDYSSVFFDYSITGKPVILFTYDYDNYASERGLYFGIEELPFARVDTLSELAEMISSRSYEKLSYADDEAYRNKVIRYDTPKAAEMLMSYMLEELEGQAAAEEVIAAQGHTNLENPAKAKVAHDHADFSIPPNSEAACDRVVHSNSFESRDRSDLPKTEVGGLSEAEDCGSLIQNGDFAEIPKFSDHAEMPNSEACSGIVVSDYSFNKERPRRVVNCPNIPGSLDLDSLARETGPDDVLVFHQSKFDAKTGERLKELYDGSFPYVFTTESVPQTVCEALSRNKGIRAEVKKRNLRRQVGAITVSKAVTNKLARTELTDIRTKGSRVELTIRAASNVGKIRGVMLEYRSELEKIVHEMDFTVNGVKQPAYNGTASGVTNATAADIGPSTAGANTSPATAAADTSTSTAGADTSTAAAAADTSTSAAGADTSTAAAGADTSTSTAGANTSTSTAGADTSTAAAGANTSTAAVTAGRATHPESTYPASSGDLIIKASMDMSVLKHGCIYWDIYVLAEKECNTPAAPSLGAEAELQQSGANAASDYKTKAAVQQFEENAVSVSGTNIAIRQAEAKSAAATSGSEVASQRPETEKTGEYDAAQNIQYRPDSQNSQNCQGNQGSQNSQNSQDSQDSQNSQNCQGSQDRLNSQNSQNNQDSQNRTEASAACNNNAAAEEIRYPIMLSQRMRKRLRRRYYQCELGDYIAFPHISLARSLAFTCRERSPYDNRATRCREVLAPAVSVIWSRLNRRRRIWLVFEKFCSAAQDNGYYFFKYCMEKLPPEKKKDIYFVIDKKAGDYGKLRPYDSNVIQFMSFKHLLYAINAKVYVGSDSRKHLYAWRPKPNLISIRMAGIPILFLQHGVTALKRSGVLFGVNGSSPMTHVTTTSEFEQNIIEEYWGYSPSNAPVLGFTRWDVLEDKSSPDEKLILVMPTWRAWLEEKPDEDFLASDYFRNYMEMLSDETLLECLEENDVKLIFFIHPKFKDYLGRFSAASDRIELVQFGSRPLNEIMMKCHMLVTDYSSVCWDVYYMGKPVIFYQFDYDMYMENHGSYMDMEHDLFGERYTELPDVTRAIRECVESGFKESDRAKEMRSRYFKYIDDDNSRRTYEYLKSKGY